MVFSDAARAVLNRYPSILAITHGLILPRTDYNPNFLEPGDGISETDFVDLLLGMSRIRTLIMHSWDFERLAPENLARLSSAGVFLDLEHWYIGWNGHFTVRGMFGLLTIMPNLKRLLVGNVLGGRDTDEADQAESVPRDDAENDNPESGGHDGDHLIQGAMVAPTP